MALFSVEFHSPTPLPVFSPVLLRSLKALFRSVHEVAIALFALSTPLFGILFAKFPLGYPFSPFLLRAGLLLLRFSLPRLFFLVGYPQLPPVGFGDGALWTAFTGISLPPCDLL